VATISSERPSRTALQANQIASYARRLTYAELPEALELCVRDPIAAVGAAARIQETLTATSLRDTKTEFWRWPADGVIKALASASGNLNFVMPTREPGTENAAAAPTAQEVAAAATAFAAQARQWGPRCTSIVGRAELVLPCWRQLAPYWPAPREVRYNQPLLVIDEQQEAVTRWQVDKRLLGNDLPDELGMDLPDELSVRRSQTSDLDYVLPACIAMYTEEMGYSPLIFGEKSFRDRVIATIDAGRSFAIIDGNPPRVVFKAEIGPVALGVAQLQGIWIPPDLRGCGIAKPALQSVISTIMSEVAPRVSLYVNYANLRARRLYQDLGFRPVGTLATVLL